jgi:hypothetical protein
MIPLIIFFVALAIFGIVDWMAWKVWNIPTMSEKLVLWSRKSKTFAWVLLGILFGAATYLAYHFELFELLP